MYAGSVTGVCPQILSHVCKAGGGGVAAGGGLHVVPCAHLRAGDIAPQAIVDLGRRTRL